MTCARNLHPKHKQIESAILKELNREVQGHEASAYKCLHETRISGNKNALKQ